MLVYQRVVFVGCIVSKIARVMREKFSRGPSGLRGVLPKMKMEPSKNQPGTLYREYGECLNS